MHARDVDSFGESLTANKDFKRWLFGLKEMDAGEDLKVSFNPASHLGYTFHSKDGFAVHVKFFGIPTGSWKRYDALGAMENEYGILKNIHNNGFNNHQHRVIRPLGVNKEFYAALATDFVHGESLSKLMEYAAKDDTVNKKLVKSLKNTAHALRKMHDSMQKQKILDVNHEFARLTEETLQGIRNKRLGEKIVEALDKWKHNPDVKSMGAVTIHGDANPTNFIANNGTLYVLDFERLERDRSPLVDLGFMTADIKHHFMFYGNNPEKAETYINEFLMGYSNRHHDRIREAVKPYVGCGLIRITKFINAQKEHRRWLVSEAFKQLK